MQVSLARMSERIKGTIIRSTGNWSSVLLPSGRVVECRLRGNYRIKGLQTTSPTSVGDNVEITLEPEAQNTGIIERIAERKNYIIRKSVNLSKQAHIIAANVDQMLVIATVHQPRTSYGFIDRLLCTAEAYNISASILINKADLNTASTPQQLQQEYEDCYKSIGYRVFTASALTGTGMPDVKEWMHNKVTLVAGHSGVGKSTVINALIPDLELRTGSLSEIHQKGTHTTTFAEMFAIPNSNGFIIDTPGIKEFGLIDMEKEEISHFFPEIFRVSEHCRFNNCQHINEPHCAVQRAVKEGSIPQSRYSSYISIIDSLQ